MTGDLFRSAPLPAQLPPAGSVRLHGPYAQQTMPHRRLKFWFAMTGHKDGARRYEAIIDRGMHELKPRYRRSGGFRDHALPDDLSPFPWVPFPRHVGDRIQDAMLALLTDEQRADVIRLARFGLIPANYD